MTRLPRQLIRHCGPRIIALIKQVIHISSRIEILEHGKENTIVKIENLCNLEEIIMSGGVPINSKSKTSCAYSKLRLQCEARRKTIVLPSLGPSTRVEMKLEISRVQGRGGWVGRILRP
ncbi:hypothetical protein AVEN_115155-1 [Araneus ventricosus]|uniref:Uncharacterized protein n=1 Tax=Araneus ventricosus TaxID=182803 RepID=A0A4Y1ZZ98_ARAVE|nr:hypothetical protein AVEN_115155-1 [Araneus ventricosus]